MFFIQQQPIQHAYGIDGLMDGLDVCMLGRMNTILLNAYHSDTKKKNYENKRCWIVLLFFVYFIMSVPNKIKKHFATLLQQT